MSDVRSESYSGPCRRRSTSCPVDGRFEALERQGLDIGELKSDVAEVKETTGQLAIDMRFMQEVNSELRDTSDELSRAVKGENGEMGLTGAVGVLSVQLAANSESMKDRQDRELSTFRWAVGFIAVALAGLAGWVITLMMMN